MLFCGNKSCSRFFRQFFQSSMKKMFSISFWLKILRGDERKITHLLRLSRKIWGVWKTRIANSEQSRIANSEQSRIVQIVSNSANSGEQSRKVANSVEQSSIVTALDQISCVIIQINNRISVNLLPFLLRTQARAVHRRH